ncbi:MAG: DUF3857 domain-containing protein [Deltaproteobacteria bacterium]|nr:DUF3857 domain-containing protein [Deltaproteobacteria bacterium]
MRQALFTLAAALALIVGACATKKNLAWEWAVFDPKVLAQASENDDAVAVVLLTDQRFVFQSGGRSRDGRTEVHFHHVIKLLTEAGLDAYSWTMPWPKKGSILHFDARSIAPDGTITPVSEREMFSDEASYGKDSKGAPIAENMRRFAFPRVQVGSMLEVAWAFEMPGYYASWTETITGSLPIEKYRAEIVVDQAMQPDLMVINHAVPPRLVDVGDGMQHLVIELDHLPARADEDLSPSTRTTEPWWMYRNIALRFPGKVFPQNSDWSDAVNGSLSGVVLKNKGAADAVLKGRAACGTDAKCLIDAALTQVRGIPWSGHDDRGFDWKKFKEIEAAGYASSSEKALMLWALLASAGVDVKLAALARAHTLEVDKTFPALNWLNHTVVVARVDGADVWLDPSCEHCGRGELPSWSRGRPAVVGVPADDKVKADWRVVTGKPPPIEDGERHSWALQANADGSVRLAQVLRTSGEDAADSCRNTRDWDQEDWRERAVEAAASASPTAHVEAFTAGVCDRARGTYERTTTSRIAAWSGRDSAGALVVPLPDFRGIWLPRDKPRKQDVVVASPVVRVHEVSITPPPGFTFGPSPASKTQQVPGGSLLIESARDGDALRVRRTLKLSAGRTPLASAQPLLGLVHASSDLEFATVTLVPITPK